MEFDNKKSDIQYLMLDGIQKKSYRNFEEIKKDMLTYFEFKFPIDTFKEELEEEERYLGKAYPTRDEFLNNFLETQLVEDWWYIINSEKFDFSSFNKDKEYLFKIGVLFKKSWQNKITITELIAENVPHKMTEFIEDWFWNRVDELSLRADTK